MGHRRSSRPLRCACALGTALLASGALAQAPFHPLPSGAPHPHESLARADAACVATVDALERDRIHVREAEALAGALPPRFAVKRSPSDPPEIAAGSRALLLLRGARTPYVLVEGSHGAVALLDADEERSWREAVRALLAADGNEVRLTAAYLEHLDDPSPTLRARAQRALLDPRAQLAPLSAAQATARARAAFDGDLHESARLASAELATRTPEAMTILARNLLAQGGEADARFLEVAVRGAARTGHASLASLVERSLGHPASWLRRRALRMAPLAWNPTLARRVARLAEGDPSERVRTEAQRLLDRVAQEKPRAR